MSIFISYIVLNSKSKLNVWWFEATKLFISAPCLLALKLTPVFLYPFLTVDRRGENELNVFFLSQIFLISFCHVCDMLKRADNRVNLSSLTVAAPHFTWATCTQAASFVLDVMVPNRLQFFWLIFINAFILESQQQWHNITSQPRSPGQAQIEAYANTRQR